jgi:PLP dependent protein
MGIAENIAEIRARMADAAKGAGRDPAEIMLLGASKMNDAAACREAIAGGIDALGENRVQEMTKKMAEGAYEGRPLHFIGHLQKNKARQVVGKVALIHSVDSMELLREIDKEARKAGVVQDVLLEVNIGMEESKSGFEYGAVKDALDEADALCGARVCGLMAIPPVSVEKGGNTPYFEKMRDLFVDIRPHLLHNSDKIYLSMGMSDDFEDAIAAGSTLVRVGTAIFGRRNYNI